MAHALICHRLGDYRRYEEIAWALCHLKSFADRIGRPEGCPVLRNLNLIS